MNPKINPVVDDISADCLDQLRRNLDKIIRSGLRFEQDPAVILDGVMAQAADATRAVGMAAYAAGQADAGASARMVVPDTDVPADVDPAAGESRAVEAFERQWGER